MIHAKIRRKTIRWSQIFEHLISDLHGLRCSLVIPRFKRCSERMACYLDKPELVQIISVSHSDTIFGFIQTSPHLEVLININVVA